MNISPENIRLIFGLKLKELRNERGYSLSELSAKTSISKSYLNEIEKGKKYPKSDKIIALCTVFDVSYEQMVSLNLNKRLSPISELICSNLLSELPLDFFGLEPIDLLTLLSAAPTKFSAFVDAIIQIGRTHNIRVESLYFSVLRSYQEMHDNYFPEIELAARKVRKELLSDASQALEPELIERILTEKYSYQIDFDGIAQKDITRDVRYIFIDGKAPRLLINKRLAARQRLFILARELGIKVMALSPRNNTPSWIDTRSFGHVLNNFKAYYFASALILDERMFTKGLVDFTKKESFNGQEVLDLIRTNNINPEPFMLRITNLVPRYFRYSNLFFVRYNEVVNDNTFNMTKQLHGSGLPRSSAVSLDIKACQRWTALTTLAKLKQQKGNNSHSASICTIYRVSYEQHNREFLVISVAQPMTPSENLNSCISVGFLINDRFAEKTNFLHDPSIKKHIVTNVWLRAHNENIEDGISKTQLLEQEQNIKKIRQAVSEITGSSD